MLKMQLHGAQTPCLPMSLGRRLQCSDRGYQIFFLVFMVQGLRFWCLMVGGASHKYSVHIRLYIRICIYVDVHVSMYMKKYVHGPCCERDVRIAHVHM